jgi:hypothetical protein
MVPPNRYYPNFFSRFTFVLMKNKREIDRRANARAPTEKLNLTKHLVGLWRDLEDNQHWKFDELSPVQLLEKLNLNKHPTDKDELARAEFFWSRRPRLLPATGYIVWIISALGLPVWLFVLPAIGLPLLITSAVVVNAGIVRSVRWRRQYEISIGRLVRHFGRSTHSTPSV